MPLKTRGKVPAVLSPLKQQGTADHGPLAPMRSLTSSSSSRALKTTIIADLNDLASPEPLASSFPILENKDVALAESLAFALQKAFPSPVIKLLMVSTLTKLKRRDNYKI
jgi:hypothetical protein